MDEFLQALRPPVSIMGHSRRPTRQMAVSNRHGLGKMLVFRRPSGVSPCSTIAQVDESLLVRLPLPLNQIFRRALNAKSPLEQHLSALYLFEVGLKLLASTAVVEYAALERQSTRNCKTA